MTLRQRLSLRAISPWKGSRRLLLTGVLGIDGARDEVALGTPAAGRGVFPSVEDDLQVELVPAILWKKTLGVALGLFHVLAVGHFPSGEQAVDVGVNGKGGNPKGLAHDYRGRFVAHGGHGFQGLKGSGHLAAVLVNNHFRKPLQALGLHGGQAHRSNQICDFFHRKLRHLRRGGGTGKERGRYGVDPCVGALCGEHHRHQQGEGVGVVQRNGRLRVQALQFVLNVPDGVGFFHGTKVDANRKYCFFVASKGSNNRTPPILSAMTHLKPGDAAPAFQSIDQNEAPVALSDFAGKKLVLYFYPKDDTPGCTAEACSFRDSYQELLDAGFAILGVSVDSPKAHQKFIAKYSLPFPLLSDGDKSVVTSYGVWGRKKFMGREFMGVLRSTFIINKEGVIVHVMGKVKTKTHHDDVLEWISENLD